jgi:enoyl-CoA hydratase/carnithine racemase
MTDDRDIRRHDRGAVRHLELHRPDVLNAWTPDMGKELLDALREAAEDTSVRSILMTGARRAFCAGADVKNARLSARCRATRDRVGSTRITRPRSVRPWVLPRSRAASGCGTAGCP